jgi:hypothetical protein
MYVIIMHQQGNDIIISLISLKFRINTLIGSYILNYILNIHFYEIVTKYNELC